MCQAQIRYVLQDGNHFKVYRDRQLQDLQAIWRAPFKVGDGDLQAAQAARKACTLQLQVSGYRVEWPEPFGESN